MVKRDFIEMFDPIELIEEDFDKAEKIRDGVKKFAKILEKNGEEGRELALAFTKLEEAAMWAIKSIGRGMQKSK